MVLSELKTGMRVILRDGSETIVLKDICYDDQYNNMRHSNILLDINDGSFASLRDYNNDMAENGDENELDIMQVYTINNSYNILKKLSDLEDWNYTLLYNREMETPIHKLTKSQIEQELGYKIEIID